MWGLIQAALCDIPFVHLRLSSFIKLSNDPHTKESQHARNKRHE